VDETGATGSNRAGSSRRPRLRSWVAGCIVGASIALAPAAADEIDLTNCAGEVVSDADFAEPIVRDHRDESYGALANPKVRPLGGGEGYDRIVPRPAESVAQPAVGRKTKGPAGGVIGGPGTVVRTAEELRAALEAAALAPRVVYVDDATEINMSFCARNPAAACRDPREPPPEGSCEGYTLTVPAHTTLASGRGRKGSRGARLFSRTFAGCALFDVGGPGVRISGLRLHGPDPSRENDDPLHCRESSAIAIGRGDPDRWATEVDNNEFSAWPNSGVQISGALGIRVHHNVFQYNRREEDDGTCDHDYGLGYPVVVGPGSVAVHANVFDHNRHDIASDGRPGAQYTATYNLILTGAVSHNFDVHGKDDGPQDETSIKGCTNIAGSAFVIHHNTFLQSSEPAVRLRGIPMRGAWIYKNETIDDDAGDAFTQIRALGNFHVSDNRTKVNRFPAWFIAFGGASFWQWRQFEAQEMGSARAGDFDGDGVADVMRNSPTGWQWSRSAREGWAFLNSIKEPVSSLALGDFVGTAITDIVRATGSEWQVSESGTSTWRPLFRTRNTIAQGAVGDFAGDGKADVFFADGTQWTIVQGFDPLVRRHHQQPFKLSELRFGNFTGDRKLEVVRSNGSEWLVWDSVSREWSHLNTSQIPMAELTFADFNGDGFTDIARTTDGRWEVSWNGRSAWQELNRSDLSLASQLIADFNGDRRADVLSRQSPDP
jgi:FG-GAP-like repeat